MSSAQPSHDSSPDASGVNVEFIASQLKATVHGDKNAVVSAIAPIDEASAGDLTFLNNDAPKKPLLDAAAASKATAILTKRVFEEIKATQIVTPNPMAAVIGLASLFYQPPRPPLGVDRDARVDETAVLGENVSIGPFAVVGRNVRIGANSIVHPHAVIYDGAQIGADCIIHSGAVVREHCQLGDDCVVQNGVVVGGEGFGYIPDPQLGHRRIPHIGRVVIGDSVDLGANTTVDRGTLGQTKIDKQTKIDNLVQVAHNVRIGQRSLVCAQVGISGSCQIGNDVTLGGQVGMADHTTISDGARAAAKSGLHGRIAEKTDVAGAPHRPAANWMKENAALGRLPDLVRRMRDVERKLEEKE